MNGKDLKDCQSKMCEIDIRLKCYEGSPKYIGVFTIVIYSYKIICPDYLRTAKLCSLEI